MCRIRCSFRQASGVLQQVPRPNDKRLAIRLTPDALRQVRGGHPWVYDDSITSVSHPGVAGDLAVIFDTDRQFAAIGLWDPASPIRLKVLHSGRPASIDGAWWRRKLQAALDLRAPLLASGQTTGFRWINGENDGFPGLVLDRYGDTVVIKLYSAAWFVHLHELVPAIAEVGRPEALILRFSRGVASDKTWGLDEGDALIGVTPPDPVMFLENGLIFEADVVHGQKTGHFLDQRDNRQFLRGLADGARTLDMFASTGGFSIYAAAGGAGQVTSVDMSEPTLAVASRNMAHNQGNHAVAATEHRTIVGDSFEVMDRLARAHERYDIVIVDPPSFAQRQTSVDRGVQAYAQLTERAVKLLKPDGLLVQASCSSRIPAELFYATVRGTVQRTGHDLEELRRTGHALDHPVTFAHGEYLKAVFGRVTAL